MYYVKYPLTKKLISDLKWVIKSANETGVSLPQIQILLDGGDNVLEAWKEYDFAVNNADNPKSIRLAYEDSNRFRTWVYSNFPSQEQIRNYERYKGQDIPKYAEGGVIGMIDAELAKHQANPEYYDDGGEEMNKIFNRFDVEVYDINGDEETYQYLLKATDVEALKYLKEKAMATKANKFGTGGPIPSADDLKKRLENPLLPESAKAKLRELIEAAEPTKKVGPTKEILEARLKLLKKMAESKPSATINARIKLVGKMIEAHKAGKMFWGGGVKEKKDWLIVYTSTSGKKRDLELSSEKLQTESDVRSELSRRSDIGIHKINSITQLHRNGGVLDFQKEGNFYVIMNDGTKEWYSEEKVERVPNVYFAVGYNDTKAGEVFVHRHNALRPLFHKNGERVAPMPQYAGKSEHEIPFKKGGPVSEEWNPTDLEILQEMLNNGMIDKQHPYYRTAGKALLYQDEKAATELLDEMKGAGLIDDEQMKRGGSIRPKSAFARDRKYFNAHEDHEVRYRKDTGRKGRRYHHYDGGGNIYSSKGADVKGYNKAYDAFYANLMESHKTPEEFNKKHDAWIKANAPKYGFKKGEYKKGGPVGKMCDLGTEVQTLIFDKGTWTMENAKEWAYKHNFSNSTAYDEKENTYRFRQADPSKFGKKSFRTIDITKGIKAVIGCPHK